MWKFFQILFAHCTLQLMMMMIFTRFQCQFKILFFNFFQKILFHIRGKHLIAIIKRKNQKLFFEKVGKPIFGVPSPRWTKRDRPMRSVRNIGETSPLTWPRQRATICQNKQKFSKFSVLNAGTSSQDLTDSNKPRQSSPFLWTSLARLNNV